MGDTYTRRVIGEGEGGLVGPDIYVPLSLRGPRAAPCDAGQRRASVPPNGATRRPSGPVPPSPRGSAGPAHSSQPAFPHLPCPHFLSSNWAEGLGM